MTSLNEIMDNFASMKKIICVIQNKNQKKYKVRIVLERKKRRYFFEISKLNEKLFKYFFKET